VPYLRGGDGPPLTGERAWRAGWVRSLFQGTATAGASTHGVDAADGGDGDGDGSRLSSSQSASQGSDRFKSVQSLLQHAVPHSYTATAGGGSANQDDNPKVQAGKDGQAQRMQERRASHARACGSALPRTVVDAKGAAERVVDFNAYGTRAQDFAAAHLRWVARACSGAAEHMQT